MTMKPILLLCGLLMTSFPLTAEETSTETCADGAGTIITGIVTGHKYCKGNNKMDWWNAYAWCDGMGKQLFSLTDDCQCSDTTANCAGNTCPELKNTGGSNEAVWVQDGSTSSTHAIHVDLANGHFDQYWARNSYYGFTPLCK